MDYQTIDTTQQLAEICAEGRDAGRIGLDTEFLWERTYAPLICLAQINVNGRVYLADPLEGIDLQPISDLISDPEVQVIMHAPHADLVAFSLRHDAQPVNTFDTQLSAGFIGLSAGLAYEKLVAEVTGRRVQPSESFTDWSRRPLAEKQLRYAGEDVEHLFAVTDTIYDGLDELGRTTWAHEELARRFDGVDRYVTEPSEAWRKVGRRGKLGPKDLSVLREVAAWRENVARTRDLPTGWISKDPTLIEISRRKPSNTKDLTRVRGIDGSMRQRDLDALLDAIEQGRQSEPIQERQRPNARGVRKRVTVAKGLASALLRALCEDRRIAVELVGTSSNVEELITWVASGEPETNDRPFLLDGWRESFGSELVKLVKGEVQLQLIDHDPFLVIHSRN